MDTDALKQMVSNFMPSVKSVIGNSRHPLYIVNQPNTIYYDAFDNICTADENDPLPEEFSDAVPVDDQTETYF